MVKRSARCFACMAVAGVMMLAGRAGRSEAQQPQLEQLIQSLGDPDPRVREASTRALWQRGEPALLALQRASGSRHPEIARRATLLVRQLELGIGPDAPPGLVALVVQARSGSAAERAQARLRIAGLPSGASAAMARMIRDALDASRAQPDPSEQVLRELWPSDPWALAALTDEMSRQGDEKLLTWLERSAAAGVSRWAAPSYAFALEQRGDLQQAIERRRSQGQGEPAPAAQQYTLLSLLYAAGDPESSQHLPPGDLAELLPFAWAMIDGDEARAAQLAAEHPDELVRMILQLLLARVADDEAAERAAVGQVRQWLSEHSEGIVASLRDAGEAQPGDPAGPALIRARRAAVAAIFAQDLPAAFSLAEEFDAPGLVRAHYRRLDFDAGAQVVARHTQRQDRQTREVQIVQRRMREELEMQPRRGMSSADVSSWARMRCDATDSLRMGEGERSVELLERLAALDEGDMPLRWSLGRALLAAGNEEAGSEQIRRARFAPLAAPWMRLELAREMSVLGAGEEALAELRTAARWAALAPVESLSALESYWNGLVEAGRGREAAEVVAASVAMLLIEDLWTSLGDRALHISLHSASELERTRAFRAAEERQWQRAVDALAGAAEYLPQSDAAIDVITRLDATGNRQLADRVFLEMYTPLARAAARYPQSSILANQAAWLAASCDRRLDTALNLAQTAVACDPLSPAAVDTLAEVYLRREQPQRALELLDRVIALAEFGESMSGPVAGVLSNYRARRVEFLERIEALAE